MDNMHQQMIVDHAQHEITRLAAALSLDLSEPHVRMRPKIYIDGNRWCALYGENLQDGVAGFGDSPEMAMLDFDKSFRTEIADAEGEP